MVDVWRPRVMQALRVFFWSGIDRWLERVGSLFGRKGSRLTWSNVCRGSAERSVTSCRCWWGPCSTVAAPIWWNWRPECHAGRIAGTWAINGSRFLANDLVSCDAVMQPFASEILARLAKARDPVPLILDQSKVSDRHQVLMLSVRWGERALPVA